MTKFAWHYWKSFNLIGIWLFEKWHLPIHSYASAMELMAMEANDIPK